VRSGAQGNEAKRRTKWGRTRRGRGRRRNKRRAGKKEGRRRHGRGEAPIEARTYPDRAGPPYELRLAATGHGHAPTSTSGSMKQRHPLALHVQQAATPGVFVFPRYSLSTTQIGCCWLGRRTAPQATILYTAPRPSHSPSPRTQEAPRSGTVCSADKR